MSVSDAQAAALDTLVKLLASQDEGIQLGAARLIYETVWNQKTVWNQNK